MLDELASLASLASSRTDLIVTRGEPHCSWSFNWKSCVITANPEDLDLRSPDYCRGLVLHESAHAALTRLHRIVPADLMNPATHNLLNVVEDCRIENWLQQRFPGSTAWIRTYNNHLFGTITDETAARCAADPAQAFLSGMLDRWWNPQPLITLHPEADAALRRTRPFFDEAVAAFPPARAAVPESMLQAYLSHQVSLCFQSTDHRTPPNGAECEIRMLQHRMWCLVWRHILPEFLKLLNHPDSEPTRQRLHLLALRKGCCGSGTSANLPAAFRTGTATLGGQNPLPEGISSRYARAAARLGPITEACGATILRFLTAESRPQQTRFHRSGHKLDLRVSMQFEADPRHYTRLWQRCTLPLHPDPAFVVAVDLSSSMQGERARATFEGLVVIREVCLRIGIPLSVIGFAGSAALIQSADNPQASGVEAKIAGVLKPDGGTNLESALHMASRLLTHCPNRHRHLWILSDGEYGDGEKSQTLRKLLRAIRADGTCVHGLGLGPKSTSLAKLLPGSATDISPRELPQVFATLLQGLAVAS
jgi:hypothetical protein